MVMNMEETSLPAANRPSGSLTKTGKTKTLIGYRADQFLHSGQEEDTEVWGTTGLGVLFIGLHTRGPGFGRTGDSPDWVRALRDQNIFPLIVIRKNKAGEEQARMEATDIERKEISDELFVVPPKYITYNKFAPDNTMPGMPGTVWIK